MPLLLHPLFATTCLEDPLPGASEVELQAAILDNPALRAMLELPPPATQQDISDPSPKDPAPGQDLDYAPPTPGFGRR